MELKDLTILELLHGTFTLTLVIISIIIGIKILIKYFSTKRIEHVTLGLAWIFLSSAWWGSTFTFLSIIFFARTLDNFTFFLIGNLFIPIALMAWIYSLSHIIYPELEKKIVMLFLVICVPYEITLIIFLLIDPNIIGTKVGTFNSIPNFFVMIFDIFALLTTIITGILFSRLSLKVDDPEIKWRGRFLLIAFISFSIGAGLDALLPLTEIPLIIVRLILISSAIEYYLGWFLPDPIANWLIKEEK